MSPERAAILLCSFLLLVCIVACICVHEDRKQRRGRLPAPRPDERDWTAIHMRDVKRWTR
jgi:hypothetical protein